MPVYLRYLGAESYGLVGFFALLQTWLQFIDAGLSGALTRDTAVYRAGAMPPATFRALFLSLQRTFLGVAALVGAVVVFSSSLIANHWLNVETLSEQTTAQAVGLMGLSLPLRLLSGLYRGVVNGHERQVWLGGFNIAVATLRFAAVVPMLMLVSSTVLAFFWFQLAASLIEVAILACVAYRHLPPSSRSGAPAALLGQPKTATSVGFGFLIGLSSVTWLLISQTDKLLLSTTLHLAEYGHFTLAAILAGVVGMVTNPIAQSVQPRLTRLVAEGAEAEAIGLYRRTTQAICIVAVPAALTLGLFSGPILRAWTGDSAIARAVAPILLVYAFGNGLQAIGAMPYYLQYAQGRLRLHTLSVLGLAAFLVPAMMLVIPSAGPIGAGAVWLTGMAAYLLFWTPIAHRSFAQGLHWPWLFRDVIAVTLPGALTVCIASQLMAVPSTRVGMAVSAAAVFLAAVASCMAASPSVRQLAADAFRSALRRCTVPSA